MKRKLSWKQKMSLAGGRIGKVIYPYGKLVCLTNKKTKQLKNAQNVVTHI